MNNGKCKRLLTVLLIAPIALFGVAATCANGQAPTVAAPVEHPNRSDWEGLAGPNFEVEDGEDFDTRARAFMRYDELERVFSQALAEEMELESGLWELLPTIHYFRMLLTQATLHGELACEDNRRCKLEAAGLAFPSGDGANPLCGDARWCNRQHSETVSTCDVIREGECVFPLGPACRRYAQKAYDLCMKVANCQLGCCLDGCSGTNCANWAVGNSDQPCVNCNMSPM